MFSLNLSQCVDLIFNVEIISKIASIASTDEQGRFIQIFLFTHIGTSWDPIDYEIWIDTVSINLDICPYHL